jgi:hypothetical protein
MSSTRLPKFLLSGIQFRRNFLGAQTIKTSMYCLIETSFKTSLVILLAGGSGK